MAAGRGSSPSGLFLVCRGRIRPCACVDEGPLIPGEQGSASSSGSICTTSSIRARSSPMSRQALTSTAGPGSWPNTAADVHRLRQGPQQRAPHGRPRPLGPPHRRPPGGRRDRGQRYSRHAPDLRDGRLREHLAYPLPIAVIGQLMGVPADRCTEFHTVVDNRERQRIREGVTPCAAQKSSPLVAAVRARGLASCPDDRVPAVQGDPEVTLPVVGAVRGDEAKMLNFLCCVTRTQCCAGR